MMNRDLLSGPVETSKEVNVRVALSSSYGLAQSLCGLWPMAGVPSERNHSAKRRLRNDEDPIAESMTNRLKTIPLLFTVFLGKLAVGEYIAVLDANGQKVAFWSSPVMLIQ